MADLKTCIYATPTEEITLTELDSFDEKSSGKYSKITKSWKDNWANLRLILSIRNRSAV